MKRRDFIKKTSLMTSTLLNTSLTEKVNFTIPPNFNLTILATNWGFQGSMDDFAKKAKDSGYEGVEIWLPKSEKERDIFLNACQKNSLKYGFLVGSGHSDFKKNIEDFEQYITSGLSLKPLYFNCHSGKDYFTPDQAKAFFDITAKLNKQTGIPIYHETHRGRLCFAAHITKQYLEKSPDLRLTLDISHWCNVHESLLDDQTETVDFALTRTEHIHARIGYAEGPQVNDPRAPEWENAFKHHLNWWDKIIENKIKKGENATILTEFGPADYMPTLPYTRQPVADQWAINVYMMKFLKERYKNR